MNTTAPLVMIHGLMGSLGTYAPERRIAGRAVHTPDLIGYGRLQAAPAQPITLAAQVAHVVRYLEEQVAAPCILLGHSVGGAIAMLVARAAPQRVRGIINVEGNFTLADAFWCGRIAGLSDSAWEAEHAQLVSDPEAWLTKAGIEPDAQRLEWARQTLVNQPRETIRAMARAVVAETGDASYLPGVRDVVERGMPLALLAGEHSASGWDLPDWARAVARAFVVLPGTGHMMMLEQPDTFCRTVDELAARLESE